MEAVERIRKHPLYIACYQKVEEAERERIFCRHQMTHLLDTARIAYIRSMEEHLGLKKEIIYAAALLHDLGKYRQYEDGTPHEEAGAEIAAEILKDIDGFTEEEKQDIVQAVREHRRLKEEMSVLGRLLYESDKLSRACYACPAEKDCNWSMEKKNLEIKL